MSAHPDSSCRILFWNVNRKDLSGYIVDVVQDIRADVVVLVEGSESATAVGSALVNSVDPAFHMPYSGSGDRFQCFSRKPRFNLNEIHNGMRVSVRKLDMGPVSSLFVLVHGVDMRNYGPEVRQSAAQSLADEIRFARDAQEIEKIIVLGDFNMNPFDPGMNLAAGLNAMMTKTCAALGKRTFLGKDYDLYYNPMWNLLGDETVGPAGTCYDTSNQGPYGWSMLDQVIINSSAVEIFKKVEIVESAGNNSLVDARGRPDSTNVSDHLPIFIELNIANNA